MSENDNNFETLRQLLALKRHEIPPPGYFEDFSSGVIGCIRAGEAVQRMPLLLRLLQMFESKPAFPVAFASSLCVLLLFGIVNVEQNPEMSRDWVTPNSDPLADVNSGNSAITYVGTNSPADTASLFNLKPNSLFKTESYSTGN
jgi:hypothetical protein